MSDIYASGAGSGSGGSTTAAGAGSSASQADRNARRGRDFSTASRRRGMVNRFNRTGSPDRQTRRRR